MIIVVTDGNETRSEASLDDAIARRAGRGRRPSTSIAIESAPLHARTAAASSRQTTGGTYYGAASTAALAGVYASIAEELKRTWQVQLRHRVAPRRRISRSRPAAAGDKPATAPLVIPGYSPPATTRSRLRSSRPRSSRAAWGALVLGVAVGLLVLVAAALRVRRGAGACSRTGSPRTSGRRSARGQTAAGGRDRLALAARALPGHRADVRAPSVWQRIADLIERGRLPLRTVEFIYLHGRLGVPRGLHRRHRQPAEPHASSRALAVGASLPYGCSCTCKAKRRLKAFEDQLPDLLITIAASLKAGHSFRQGLQAVVEEDQEPASKEFKRVLTETRLGRPMDGALAEMARRVGSKNLEFVHHGRDDPAPGRRLAGRDLRHGRRHRSQPAAVRSARSKD